MVAEEKVMELNAKWRNYVAQVMGMDPKSAFQVVQGSLGLVSEDSSGLFEMSDATPKDCAAGYYDPSSMNKRSSSYSLLLVSLLPEPGYDLRTALGDMYASWVTYRTEWSKKNPKPDDQKNQEQAFNAWADGNLDPREKAKAINAYKQAAILPLNKAIDDLTDPNNQQTFIGPDQKPFILYKYTANITQAKNALARGSTISNFKFDSATADSNLQHTFAEGAASGFYSIFSGGAAASFESLNAKAANSRITVEGSINQFATLPTSPIGWYNSGEVNRALKAPGDATVWDPIAGQNWDNFFGKQGSLARYMTQFLLVSGYDLKVTIYASFTKEEFEEIKAKATFGIWPFVSASASFVHTSKFVLNEDSSISFTQSLAKGNVEIWAVTFEELA